MTFLEVQVLVNTSTLSFPNLAFVIIYDIDSTKKIHTLALLCLEKIVKKRTTNPVTVRVSGALIKLYLQLMVVE